MKTIADLIEHLQTLPQDLPVGYRCYSEECLLDFADLKIEEHCAPREDGWIQNKRPDKPSIKYLIFPGN